MVWVGCESEAGQCSMEPILVNLTVSPTLIVNSLTDMVALVKVIVQVLGVLTPNETPADTNGEVVGVLEADGEAVEFISSLGACVSLPNSKNAPITTANTITMNIIVRIH